MKTYSPEYFEKFKCIADRCRHSCCVGWEICIDSETLDKYKTVEGQLGKRLKENIAFEEDAASFVLDNNERCPFLNSSGLCDIIIEKGDSYLCEICREHPRFYNFFSDRTEMGIGLSCEEAARIILSSEGKMELIVTDEDEYPEERLTEFEKYILSKRAEIIPELQDREKSIDTRVEAVLTLCNISFPDISLTEWLKIFSELEILDQSWLDTVSMLGNSKIGHNIPDVAFEQLLVYLVYRHTPLSEDKGDFADRIAFACLGYKIIKNICERTDNCNFDMFCEICRMYSSEIEYSEDNTAALIDIFKNNRKNF